GPEPGATVLTYERGLLAEEANYLRLVAVRAPEIPVPRVLAESDDWLFMSLVPGGALPSLPANIATHAVGEECGATFAGLHEITGDFFGYAGDRPRASTWPDAYAAMIDALLDDALRFDVTLPVPPDSIRAAITANHAALATVRR